MMSTGLSFDQCSGNGAEIVDIRRALVDSFDPLVLDGVEVGALEVALDGVWRGHGGFGRAIVLHSMGGGNRPLKG